MSTRTRLFLSIGFLIIAGITLLTLARHDREPSQTFSATINRDCTPWDGSAFTVAIPLQNMGITVSIYQAPDLIGPTSFLFPDDTMRIGNALLIFPLGSPESLQGKVSFQRVVQDLPVEGRFDLMTNDGQRFNGKFTAEWGNDIVLCG